MGRHWWQRFWFWREHETEVGQSSSGSGDVAAGPEPKGSDSGSERVSPPPKQRRWYDWSNPGRRVFHKFDFLFRLAEQTIYFLEKELGSEQDRQIIREMLLAQRISDRVSDPQLLAVELSNSPKLQEFLSYRVNYTPSRWLVEREIPEIQCLRRSRKRPTDEKISAQDYPYDWMHENSITGLCFSGGGIRSATFNLGILQALARHRDAKGNPYLERFDYLSTVSGGGYIHEWLAAWIKRTNLHEVEQQLVPLPEEGCPPFHPAPLRWLRRFSNYLTPRKGLFSTDTWVAVAIWLRNTFLNQLVLISLLLVLMLAPHLLVAPNSPLKQGTAMETLPDRITRFKQGCPSIGMTGSGNCSWLFGWTRWYYSPAPAGSLMQTNPIIRKLSDLFCALRDLFCTLRHNPRFLAISATLFFLIAVSIMMASLLAANQYSRAESGVARRNQWRGGGQKVAIVVVLLFLLSALFVSRLVLIVNPWTECRLAVYRSIYLLLLSANIGIASAGGTLGAFEALNAESQGRLRWRDRISLWLKGFGGLVFLFSAIAAGAATFLFILLRWVLCGVLRFSFMDGGPWGLAVIFGPPLFLSVPFFSQVLLAGLIGRDFADSLREWLARVRAWSLLMGAVWLVWFGIALLGRPAIGLLFAHWPSTSIKWSAVAAWILTTIGSVLAGKSGKTDGTKPDLRKSTLALDALAIVGPYVFIAGLMLILGYFGDLALHSFPRAAVYVLPLLVFALFGWRVDINEFSMHAFYRNRLSRCYLGASNLDRRPNPLTGFDESDVEHMELSRFSRFRAPRDQKATYEGPFPIFCAALNLTFGEDLAWQDRKAASFAFTPLYSGYHVGWTEGRSGKNLSYSGYVPTNCYAYPKGGISIATAAAISGAAVSPNWGYHTNPATAFLLTMFNVRLGWWLRNPRTSRFAGWGGPSTPDDFDPDERPSPGLPALQLSKEMLGQVDDASDFVYLTDGGHFDNMGLYELIRRRCRYIVVCDSEEDHNYSFGGFGNAIRRCRVDFGVDIEIDLAPLRPQLDPQLGYPISKQHFQVGIVRYPERSGKKITEQGTLLYIKSSLTGPQPTYPGCVNLPWEPGDIINHKLCHSPFPNDSTINQWFDEQTFESYRRLGIHIAEEISKSDVWKSVIP